ncbi:LysE family transporter [Streptacidiphilus sp. ASG 303]|uniref:LysE family transporter n=1 Tax=Streptacidiphilus sp. ASG 303 TaxID=2896847 RepID=UPI001E5C76E2|nr:LysE family transporter [Streptacidiphilus sp. ASG 303]MCD0481081.1 LysE family transporter [Streptacidiphilus sp. ASG 303]
MTAALVAGALAGYGIAVPVGAVATYLLSLSARTSLRTGAAAALGVATADGLYALLAAAGGSALAGLLAPITGPLRLASAAVLLALALRSTVAAVRAHRAGSGQDPAGEAPVGPGRAYAGFLGLTLLNPTTVVYFTALVLGSRTASAAPGRAEQAAFVLGAFAASASWQLLLAGGGALLGRVLAGPRGRLATALASGALVTVLAVRLLLPSS